MMQVRRWVESGIVEEFDEKQTRFLELVMEKVRFYYKELYRTAPRYRHPLSINRLSKLCNRAVYAVSAAVRILANSVGPNESAPRIYYERVHSQRHHAKRPFRIFLK